MPPEEIVQACEREHILLCGLSALMTTTVPAMEETIRLLRERCPDCRVMVGGAVLNADYAKKIGAGLVLQRRKRGRKDRTIYF